MNINTEGLDDYILGLIQPDIVQLPKRLTNSKGEKLYLNNVIDLKSNGDTFDYLEGDKIYKYIDDEGEVLKEPIIIDLIKYGNLTILSEDKITFEDIALHNTTYDNGIEPLVDRPIIEVLNLSKSGQKLNLEEAIIEDGKLLHPKLKNGDSVILEYKYNKLPYSVQNSIYYTSPINDSSIIQLTDEDLNTLKDINTYYVSDKTNVKNCPEDIEDMFYLYVVSTKKDEIAQLIENINSGDKYIRYCKNNEWFPWSKELGEVVADRLKGAIRLVGDIEGEASFVNGVTTVNTKSTKLVSRYEIVRGDDLNNLTKTGMYGSNGQVSIKNKPTDEVVYFTLNVINRQNDDESTLCSQQLIDTQTNNVWIRSKHTNGWSEWKNLCETNGGSDDSKTGYLLGIGYEVDKPTVTIEGLDIPEPKIKFFKDFNKNNMKVSYYNLEFNKDYKLIYDEDTRMLSVYIVFYRDGQPLDMPSDYLKDDVLNIPDIVDFNDVNFILANAQYIIS